MLNCGFEINLKWPLLSMWLSNFKAYIIRITYIYANKSYPKVIDGYWLNSSSVLRLCLHLLNNYVIHNKLLIKLSAVNELHLIWIQTSDKNNYLFQVSFILQTDIKNICISLYIASMKIWLVCALIIFQNHKILANN